MPEVKDELVCPGCLKASEGADFADLRGRRWHLRCVMATLADESPWLHTASRPAATGMSGVVEVWVTCPQCHNLTKQGEWHQCSLFPAGKETSGTDG